MHNFLAKERITLKFKISQNIDKFIWGGLHPFSYHPFVFNFIPDLRGKTFLDCGCGKGIYGFLIRVTRALEKSTLIGLDIRKEYLEFCKKHNIYDKLIHGSVTKLPFKGKSIDLIICSGVIEHLNKKLGDELFNEIDRVCKERAIITTPNIFYQTYKEAKADAHHSYWNANSFRNRGYKVYGIGLKIVMDRHDRYYKIKQALSIVVTPISYIFPIIAGSLICVKDFEK